MNKQFFLSLLLFVFATCAIQYSFAQKDIIYVFEKKILLPGNGGYDYVSIDTINRKLYVSHGTTVNVVDLNTETVTGSIDNMKGVHGIAIVNEANKGFISDGRGDAVIAFDLKSLKTIATIPLSKKGPDGIIYDFYSKKVLAFCGDANAACVIDVSQNKEVATIDLGGGPEFAVSDGKGLVYNNLEDKSSLNVIDTRVMKVIRNYSLSPCGGPTGIALDVVGQRAFTVCRENKGMSVIDIHSGKVVATIPIGAGVDAVVYDAFYKRIVASNGDGTATVIKQNSPDDYSVVQTLHTAYRAKTMALDPLTHKIYFSAGEFQPGTRNIIPGTFAVWVYKLNQK
ncbi:MAG: YncE family protein [Bacteroidota bacterium]|nr:YncE family protein [Bacteroidota bacterium]